jgi:hypothetical protein
MEHVIPASPEGVTVPSEATAKVVCAATPDQSMTCAVKELFAY